MSNPQDPDILSADNANRPSLKAPEDVLIIVPVRNMVLFPGVVQPVAIGREKSIAAAREAIRSGRKIGFLLQRDPDAVDPKPRDLYPVGTVASILRLVTAQDESQHLICQGEQRFRVLDFPSGFPFLLARVEFITEPPAENTNIEARTLYLKQLAGEAVGLL